MGFVKANKQHVVFFTATKTSTIFFNLLPKKRNQETKVYSPELWSDRDSPEKKKKQHRSIKKDSRSQEEINVSKKAGFTEEGAVRIEKEPNLDSDERIEITDSSHDHDKSSSSSSSSSRSSSDDESREVKKKDEVKETEVSTVSSVPDQPVPIAGDAPFIAGDAPFMGASANAIVESTGLMDSTMSSDPKAGEHIEISHVDTIISNEDDLKSLPKPNETIAAEVSLASDETKQASSITTDSDVNKGTTSPLPESSSVLEDIRESEVCHFS